MEAAQLFLLLHILIQKKPLISEMECLFERVICFLLLHALTFELPCLLELLGLPDFFRQPLATHAALH